MSSQEWWRSHKNSVELHLVEAIENVERLLAFVTKIAHDPTCPQNTEANAILRDFGRVNDDTTLGRGVVASEAKQGCKEREDHDCDC